MKSAKVTAFMSCSFDPKDRNVSEYFNAICQGLDIQCANVSDGYKESPPEKAREMIEDSQLFIALRAQEGKRFPAGRKL